MRNCYWEIIAGTAPHPLFQSRSVEGCDTYAFAPQGDRREKVKAIGVDSCIYNIGSFS